MTMEEQILKILDKYKDIALGDTVAAEEIAAHFTEFIEWKDEETGKYLSHINLYFVTDSGISMTLDELYNYWLTNIKK